MNKDGIYSIWAPDQSPWSQWAKPVLFAHLDRVIAQAAALHTEFDTGWAPELSKNFALVLDLPGAEAVAIGIALAQKGYRPIPLYNALPPPMDAPLLNPETNRTVAAVDVVPILTALRTGAGHLATLHLLPDAPPAFLLDADRACQGRKMEKDAFDNRSISFTTDFPSANFLAAHNIERILLVQKDRLDPQPDLAHTLRRWQDGGLALRRLRLDYPAIEPFKLAKPLWYGLMFQRALAAFGMASAQSGGFGGWMPDSSAGG